MRSGSSALAAAAAATLALGGCGTETLKTDDVKRTIAQQFKAQGVPLHAISCRDDIEAKVGARIDCTARNAADTELVIKGRVRSVREDRANFHVEAVSGVARGAVIAAQARRLLEAKVGQKAAGMTCPARVPIPTKPTVTCELRTRDGQRYDATVRVGANAKFDVQVASALKR